VLFRSKYDAAVAKWNSEALAAEQKFREISDQYRASREAAQVELDTRRVVHEKDLASVRAAAAADVKRLRDAFANAASHSGSSAANSAPASTDDCPALAGRLLGEVLQTTAELADDAERNADAYRALRSAWPTVAGATAQP
jgi:hypothetical protein